MRKPIIFCLSSTFTFPECEKADFVLREFPDGESYVKINTDIKEREIIVVDTLNNPNSKIVPLLFLAKILREQGAKSITLVSPYLPYMRQDKIVHANEALTSQYFGELLSTYFDKLITVDPHLREYKDLKKIYSLESIVLHATHEISEYIKNNVKNPVIIGPDGGSEQSVKEIAANVGAPYVIAQKKRHSDYEVEMVIPNIDNFKHHIPVLVDDIISTAQTMIKAITYLKEKGLAAPICIGVHAVFAGEAYEDLLAAGPEKIITCNTIKHITNKIDLTQLLASAL